MGDSSGSGTRHTPKKGKYIDVDGKPVPKGSARALVWYSATCSYWTDDWSKLALSGPGIPVCPHCQSPGYQDTVANFQRGAEQFQGAGNPGYVHFLIRRIEQCHFSRAGGLGRLWEQNKFAAGMSVALRQAVRSISEALNGDPEQKPVHEGEVPGLTPVLPGEALPQVPDPGPTTYSTGSLRWSCENPPQTPTKEKEDAQERPPESGPETGPRPDASSPPDAQGDQDGARQAGQTDP